MYTNLLGIHGLFNFIVVEVCSLEIYMSHILVFTYRFERGR